MTKLNLSRLARPSDALRPIDATSFALAEGAGRIDRVTIRGDDAEIATLRDGLSGPTGVDVAGGIAWYVEGQLSYLFDGTKRALPPPRPFRITPVAIEK